MANSTNYPTWVLDTAGVITTGAVYVTRMEWHPNAVDNDLEVRDNYGATKWIIRAIAASANNESIGIETWDNPSPNTPFHGFDLETIDGGKLYVTTG